MKQKMKVCICGFLCAILLCGNFAVANASEAAEKIGNHAYEITLNETNEFFIGNENGVSPLAGESKVCLVYTVEENTTEKLAKPNEMIGIIATTNATMQHPYVAPSGALRTTDATKADFFTKGYTYFFCFERTENGLECAAYKTDGKVAEEMKFYGGLGPNDAGWTNYGIWFRSFDEKGVNAVLTNVRCYDGEYNELGVVCTAATGKSNIEFSGEMTDYSMSYGAYCCDEKEEILVLKEGLEIDVINADGKEESSMTYKIYDKNKMFVFGDDSKDIYVFENIYIEDSDGNKYFYVQNPKVTFVNGEESFVVEPTMETLFKVEKPEDPVKEGDVFEGWYLGDDTEYDFDKFVTESITLYAKWQNDNDYLSLGSLKGLFDNSTAAIVLAVAILGISAGSCYVIRRKKSGGK